MNEAEKVIIKKRINDKILFFFQNLNFLLGASLVLLGTIISTTKIIKMT